MKRGLKEWEWIITRTWWPGSRDFPDEEGTERNSYGNLVISGRRSRDFPDEEGTEST